MAMNPVILEPLLLGTIARDAHVLPRGTWPASDGPGIYAVGIAVNGRNGNFLRGRELLEVVTTINAYADGWDSLQAPNPKTKQQYDRVRKAEGIEDALIRAGIRSTLVPSLRFIQNNEEASRVRVLAERLLHRANASLAVDPSSTTVMAQSPLYIGCSSHLRARTANYKLSNFARIKKLMELTVTAMQHCQYDPILTVKPVLRIWDNNHLPIAEIMLSTIARSLVALSGFNSTEARGRQFHVNVNTLRSINEDVFYHEGWHAANLDDAKHTLLAKLEYDESAKSLQEAMKSLEMRVNSVSTKYGGPIPTASEFATQMDELGHRIDKLSQVVARRREELNMAKLLVSKFAPLTKAMAEMGLLPASSTGVDATIPGTGSATPAAGTATPAVDAMIPGTDSTTTAADVTAPGTDNRPASPQTSLDDLD